MLAVWLHTNIPRLFLDFCHIKCQKVQLCNALQKGSGASSGRGAAQTQLRAQAVAVAVAVATCDCCFCCSFCCCCCCCVCVQSGTLFHCVPSVLALLFALSFPPSLTLSVDRLGVLSYCHYNLSLLLLFDLKL